MTGPHPQAPRQAVAPQTGPSAPAASTTPPRPRRAPAPSRSRRAPGSAWRSVVLALCTWLAHPQHPALAGSQTAQSELLRSDSRAPYVHRINLYDHDGQVIDPKDPDARPYSPARTCGKCHAYGQIQSGWHFNAGRADVDNGRPGEPWIYTDPATGTQLPLSKRRWPGTRDPASLGLSDWDFLLRFGAHLPGGLPPLLSEPSSAGPVSDESAFAPPATPGDRSATGLSDPQSTFPAPPDSPRWAISGPLEIDCLFCHAASLQHDPAELARQLERQNLRWSATVAAGLAVIRGDARSLPDDFDPLAPPNPDYPDRNLPKLIYDTRKFDADDRVLLDLTRRAPNQRCYFCHTQRLTGPDAPPAWATEQDVHLAAGLLCVDCHRHGIDHAITRGYEGDPALAATAHAATLTCRGCHLGQAKLTSGPDGRSGRLGAPYPEHRGIPLVHFEKLACTACHSGPWPQDAARRFQTAMSHGLGLATRDRGDHDPPTILGPIFARNQRNQLAPHRMIWPAFWGVRKEHGVEPLPLAHVQRAIDKLDARAKARRPADLTPLTETELVTLLTQLRGQLKPGEGTPVYIRDGRLYELAEDGTLRSLPHDAAAPYLWPLAHDVRPAAQSLGVRGCTDCHAPDAPLYFGRLCAADEADAARRPMQRMYEISGLDPAFARLFNASFRLREAFKLAGLACAAIIAVVLLRALFGASPPESGN